MFQLGVIKAPSRLPPDVSSGVLFDEGPFCLGSRTHTRLYFTSANIALLLATRVSCARTWFNYSALNVRLFQQTTLNTGANRVRGRGHDKNPDYILGIIFFQLLRSSGGSDVFVRILSLLPRDHGTRAQVNSIYFCITGKHLFHKLLIQRFRDNFQALLAVNCSLRPKQFKPGKKTRNRLINRRANRRTVYVIRRGRIGLQAGGPIPTLD